MTKEAYIKAILRKSRFSRATKKRIAADLESDIAARQDAGAEMAEIIEAMGTPEEVAKSLAESMPQEVAAKKTSWRWAVLALAGVMAVFAVVWAVEGLSDQPPIEPVPQEVGTMWILQDLPTLVRVSQVDHEVELSQVSYTVTVDGGGEVIVGYDEEEYITYTATYVEVPKTHTTVSYVTMDVPEAENAPGYMLTSTQNFSQASATDVVEALGLCLGCVGGFLLLQWKGSRQKGRYAVLGGGLLLGAAALMGWKLFAAAQGLSFSLLVLWKMAMVVLLNPAFLLLTVCGILALRRFVLLREEDSAATSQTAVEV